MEGFENSGNDVFKQKGEDIWNKRRQEDSLAHIGSSTEDVFKNKENDVLKHRNENIFEKPNFQFTTFPNDRDLGHIVRNRSVTVSKLNTIFIVFGLTRPGFEPTIYNTRDEHANHYATDAVHYGK